MSIKSSAAFFRLQIFKKNILFIRRSIHWQSIWFPNVLFNWRFLNFLIQLLLAKYWLIIYNKCLFYISFGIDFFYTFHQIKMFYLLSMKTLCSMILKSSSSSCYLNKSYHRFIAFWLKAFIVSSSHWAKCLVSIFQWITAETFVNIISEIGNKSKSIIQLNSKCLIVNWTPSTLNNFSITLAFLRALLSSCLILITHFNSIYFFILGEWKIVIRAYYLQFIWYFMSTYFLCFKYIYILDIWGYMEIPYSKCFIS